jgi:hypothetical protein
VLLHIDSRHGHRTEQRVADALPHWRELLAVSYIIRLLVLRAESFKFLLGDSAIIQFDY